MSILPLLASSLGRADEEPNISLATAIAASDNTHAIRELVEVLNGKDQTLKSDALKTLYEVGYRTPSLIAPYIAQFKNLPRKKPIERLDEVIRTFGLEAMRARFAAA